jgi:hypothetical protein
VVTAVKKYTLNAVMIAFTGFFIGSVSCFFRSTNAKWSRMDRSPMTPKVLSAVSARVPHSLKAPVMSLTIGIGLIGSAVAPLVFGVAVERGALGSLPLVLVRLLCSYDIDTSDSLMRLG